MFKRHDSPLDAIEGGKMQSDYAATAKGPNELSFDIAPLNDKDLPQAERIFRVAFGTFLGAPDPEVFWADRDYICGRHRAPHVAGFGATIDGNLVGSNFATKWGSVGFFGPLIVRPDLRERGIAQACSPGQWSSSTRGKCGMSGCSPSPTARSISLSIKSTVFTRAFLPQSCRRPLAADQVRPWGGLVSAT
jgi:hypothetical protein